MKLDALLDRILRVLRNKLRAPERRMVEKEATP